MNPNWARWTAASVVKHFDALRQNIALYVEGRVRPVTEPGEQFELRLDGPSAKEFTKGHWQLDIEINVLIKWMRHPLDAYRGERLKGIVQAAFTNSIRVYNYGDDDPAELIGCLQLRSDGREGIITSDFGLIDASQTLRQATVEGHYRMELRT